MYSYPILPGTRGTVSSLTEVISSFRALGILSQNNRLQQRQHSFQNDFFINTISQCVKHKFVTDTEEIKMRVCEYARVRVHTHTLSLFSLSLQWPSPLLH